MDGRTFTYAIPVDTWGVVATVAGGKPSRTFTARQFATRASH